MNNLALWKTPQQPLQCPLIWTKGLVKGDRQQDADVCVWEGGGTT